MGPIETAAIASEKAALRAPRLSGRTRVWLLTTAVAVAAVATLAGMGAVGDLRAPVGLPAWILALLFCASEVFVVRIHIRRDAHAFSLNEIPLVLGLFFVSPTELVLAQLVGAALALAVFRRQGPMKVAFNTAHLTLEAVLAAWIFHSIVSTADPTGPAGWIGAFAATFVAITVSVVTVMLAISASEGRFQPVVLRRVFGFGTIVSLANTALSLLAVNMLWLDARAAWLLLVPTAVLFLAYRGYTEHRRKHESLEFLYESTRTLSSSLEVESAIETLLGDARKMFKSELASITLFPEDEAEGGPSTRTTLGPGDHLHTGQVQMDPKEGVWARVTSEGEPLLLAHPIANERLHRYFELRGIRDAIVAPLHGEDGVLGTMMVANRVGGASTFDDKDLKLFETLANHASVSLQNARLVSRLEESLAHLTEMNRLKDDFVASVSHELRTPLTSILGFVQVMMKPEASFTPEESHSFLHMIEGQGKRLRNLIEDLLVVSRIETQTVRPTLSGVAIDELLGTIVEDARVRSLQTIELDVDEELPVVETDEVKVYQIVTNLLNNAVKYTPPGTTIRVSARRADGGALVRVADEGDGIPGELHDKIFERFYQVDQSSTRSVGGTGLGLYLCRKLAEVIDGRVWLEKSDGSGSLFCLWVPLGTAPGMGIRPRRSSRPTVDASAAD